MTNFPTNPQLSQLSKPYDFRGALRLSGLLRLLELSREDIIKKSGELQPIFILFLGQSGASALSRRHKALFWEYNLTRRKNALFSVFLLRACTLYHKAQKRNTAQIRAPQGQTRARYNRRVISENIRKAPRDPVGLLAACY